MSNTRKPRQLVLANAWLAGRTAGYRGETVNPFPRSEPECREMWESGRDEAEKDIGKTSQNTTDFAAA
jgi:hypothetical protein